MKDEFRTHAVRAGSMIAAVSLGFSFAVSAAGADSVTTSQKDHEIVIKNGDKTETILQKRWIMENAFVRLAVTDDPGGAVVEFLNKQNNVNHVAGEVYSRIVDGKPEKKTGYCWKELNIYDNATDPQAKHMISQKFKVEFLDGEAGAKTIKVTGQTAEQKIERWHTLKPGSAELLVRTRLTNISDKPRRLWMRWHPYSFVSGDKYGDSGCVLVPGEGAQVRKIRIGWGWDHWFRTHADFWMAGDFKSGDGLFMTLEKENDPLLSTWTNYGKRSELKGSVVLEAMPPPEIHGPGEFIEKNYTYFPFSKDTKPEDIPLGLIKDKAEQERARAFLKSAKPPEHMAMFNSYTFAQTIQFSWHHRRRDIFGLRDWGFADCAIVGFPIQGLPMRVRMVGGVFHEAASNKPFNAECNIPFIITVTDKKGVEVYRAGEQFPVTAGIPGQNYFDREIPIPTMGMPDGEYVLRVAALDPVDQKPFHSHQTDIVVFGKRMQLEAESNSEMPDTEPPRPFVTALAKLADVKVSGGKASIPIGVEDGSGVARKAFPVRLGIPFPQGAFEPDAPARLLSPAGKPVPAQFRVMNVWPDKSLKWLQADFQADCPANGHAFYTLEAGTPASEKAGADLASETADSVELNTGSMLVRISRKQAAIPGEVFIDKNKDGKFEDSEKVMLASQPGDAWWTDGTNGQYSMQFAGEAVDGIAPGVRIERNGPLSASVKILGWYLDKNGQRAAIGEVRIETWKDKAALKIWHQVTYAGNPWRNKLKSYGLKLRVAPDAYQKTSFAVDGKTVETGETVCDLFQKTSDIASITAGGKALKDGARASGALALSGATGSVLVHHLNLWQMYPKQLSADLKKGEIAIHYWPAKAGIQNFEPFEEFWMPSSSSSEACGTGLSRTQEIVVDFSGAVPPAESDAVYSEPVVACTPPKWVQQTRVINNLYPYDPEKYPEVEEYISLVIDFYNNNREFFKWYGQWDYGTIPNVYEVGIYQWLLRGRYPNIGNEEDINQGPWLAYFRTGDRKYLKFATLWTRHLMETQSIRWSNIYPEWAGMSRRHHYTTWLGGGDFGHTMLCPWLEYYHATGYAPAWDMALLTARSMANTYEGSWRYIINPLIGNIRMYLETGEQKYKDVADRIWKDLMYPDRNEWYVGTHGSRLAIWYAPFNPDCMKAWKEWSKTGLTLNGKTSLQLDDLDSLGALGDMTGDDYYAHRARMSLDNFRATYTGQTKGVNPVYRGMVPTISQYIMQYLRAAPFAAGQIAKAKSLFPAGHYNIGGVKEIVIRENKDAAFTVWMNARDLAEVKISAPDGKPAQFDTEVIFEYGAFERKTHPTKLLKITVKADGQTGCYRIPSYIVGYLGCSLKEVALRCGKTINSNAGAPLYARSKDLGGKNARIIMKSTPGNSFEVFALDGKRLFSQTHYRPENDAMGLEYNPNLPPETVVRLGDKMGVTFPELEEIPLFLNPDGIFDLPAMK